MINALRCLITTITAGAVLAGSALAYAAPRDLIGVRAGQGEQTLRDRGYAFDHNARGVQYWWQARDRECINLFVDDGRYSTIERRPASECNLSRGGQKDDSGAIIAGALAIAILAAAASKKKHDDDDRDRRRDDRRDDPPYSPGRGVDCYPSQRACYEQGRGYSPSWTSREFGYRY